MKLSTWRPALRSWLISQLPVTSESLDRPIRPGDAQLVIEPIRDISINELDQSTVMATGYQDVILSVRLDGDQVYSQLPLATYEGLYISMMLKFQKRWADIIDTLHDLTCDNDNRVATAQLFLTEATDGQGDWQLDLTWTLKLVWEAELEDEPLYSGDITKLNINLWRSDLADFDNRTLDAVIEIEPVIE